MTLKINNNTSAINAHRNLLLKDKSINSTLEKISTGLEIVRGSDGPASLVISEQLRSQTAGLQQAVKNTETAVSMIQTTEAALEEVSRMLIELRRLAVHASNDAANDPLSLQASQYEVEAIIDALNRIAKQTSFGSRKLLDGSGALKGAALGNGLEFVSGTVATESSPTEGYEVKVVDLATKASLLTEEFPDTEIFEEGEVQTVTLVENSRSAQYDIKFGDKIQDVAAQLNRLARENGLELTISVVRDDQLLIEHNEYGANHVFSAASSGEDFISDEPNKPKFSVDGRDITGFIGGYKASGKGQELVGAAGTPIEGLKVRFNGVLDDYSEEGVSVGRVIADQNSLLFQVGADFNEFTNIVLSPTFAKDLARGIVNDSNYQSIADIDLRSFQGAQDALKLVVAASNDISTLRGRLGALQKNSLEATSNYLRNSVENIIASESTIRDADIAEKSAELIRHQIQRQGASIAALHAGNSPKGVVSLLGAIQS